MILNREELLRYQRHLTLPGFGKAAQLRLKSARVLVIGAGGLGCPVLQYLAAAGVGTLGIVDDDIVSRSNLQRQILFCDTDVGQLKAPVAAARLRAMNPTVSCDVHAVRLTVDNALELIGAYDLVIDGSDNFVTRYLVNDACVLTGKPLVYGALYTFHGQASVFNYNGGPTYRCLFPDPPDPRDAPNCAEIGVLGVLPGMIGVVQAMEAIKILCGIGEPLSGRLMIFDALEMSQQIVRFERVPARATVTELRAINYACEAQSAGVGDVSEDETTVETLQSRLSDGIPLQVIDVREDWERALCCLDSVHVPLSDWTDGEVDIGKLGLRPDVETLVYCKAGGRSLQALKILRDRYGFTNSKSLRGGILQWANSIDSTMRKY